MEYTETVDLLTEYNQWKADRKAMASDVSPDTFMVDRAKNQALEALVKIAAIVNDDVLLDKAKLDKIKAEVLGP